MPQQDESDQLDDTQRALNHKDSLKVKKGDYSMTSDIKRLHSHAVVGNEKGRLDDLEDLDDIMTRK